MIDMRQPLSAWKGRPTKRRQAVHHASPVAFSMDEITSRQRIHRTRSGEHIAWLAQNGPLGGTLRSVELLAVQGPRRKYERRGGLNGTVRPVRSPRPGAPARLVISPVGLRAGIADRPGTALPEAEMR